MMKSAMIVRTCRSQSCLSRMLVHDSVFLFLMSDKVYRVVAKAPQMETLPRRFTMSFSLQCYSSVTFSDRLPFAYGNLAISDGRDSRKAKTDDSIEKGKFSRIERTRSPDPLSLKHQKVSQNTHGKNLTERVPLNRSPLSQIRDYYGTFIIPHPMILDMVPARPP